MIFCLVFTSLWNWAYDRDAVDWDKMEKHRNSSLKHCLGRLQRLSGQTSSVQILSKTNDCNKPQRQRCDTYLNCPLQRIIIS